MPPEVAAMIGMEGNPLERIRAAILSLKSSGQSVTTRAVLGLAKGDAVRLGKVVKAWKEGAMPALDVVWDAPRPKPTPTPWPAQPEPKSAAEPKPATLDRNTPLSELPLGREIQQADTVERLELVGRRVTVAILEEVIPAKVGDLVISGLKEQRQAMKMRLLERQDQAVAAIEVLTPEERALLEAHRAARAPKPLQPGEAALPP